MHEAISPSQSPALLVELLRDYVNFTRHLLNIIKKSTDQVRDFCHDGSKSRFEELAGMHEDFQPLRIHDVVGKVAFDQLRAKLWDQRPIHSEDPDFILSSNTFLSRGTPGIVLEFAYTIEAEPSRKVGFGIQIQGKQYRHYVTVAKPLKGVGTLLELAQKMGQPNERSANLQRWWNVDSEPLEAPKGESTSGQPKHDEIAKAGFNRFGAEAFLYTQTDISELCFPALVDKVKASIQLARGLLEDKEFRSSAKNFVGTASGSS